MLACSLSEELLCKNSARFHVLTKRLKRSLMQAPRPEIAKWDMYALAMSDSALSKPFSKHRLPSHPQSAAATPPQQPPAFAPVLLFLFSFGLPISALVGKNVTAQCQVFWPGSSRPIGKRSFQPASTQDPTCWQCTSAALSCR